MPAQYSLVPFGILCREIRYRKGYRLLEQSESIGVPIAEIAAIEAGVKRPSPEYAEKVAAWLDISPEEHRKLKRSTSSAKIMSFEQEKDRRRANASRALSKIS